MKSNLLIAGTLVLSGAVVCFITYQFGSVANKQPSQIIKPMESDNVKELKAAMRAAVVIDELALDKECIRLPGDFLKYAHRAAEIRAQVDECKTEIERVEARLSRDIRANPGTYGLEKITESGINAIVSTRKEYKAAQDAFSEAKYSLDLVQAVLTAFEHKKRSLTLLVDLHGMSYFANPRLSSEGRETVNRMTKNAVRKQRTDEE